MTTKPTDSGAHFSPIEDVLLALQQGEMIIVTDDEHREGEGDLIVAAEHVTPDAVNFMATHGRGLICVAMESVALARLGLKRMPQHGSGDPFKTAFMESVDAAEDITTGISAFDRSETIRILADEGSGPSDLMVPGHVFPLEAVHGGVLVRAGHTEAAVDLTRLAGLTPSGVICEILRDDGQMARMPELITFAEQHGLKMTSVAMLLNYRQSTEQLVELERKITLPTEAGTFDLHLFTSCVTGEHHLALVMGDITTPEPVMVRVHSECLTGDVFGSLRCDCGSQISKAMHHVAEEGRGVVLYMRQEGRGIGLAKKIHAYALQEEGYDTVEANHQLGFQADLRDYGLSAQILKALGVHRLRLMTNNPQKITGLEDYGLEVTERIPLVLPHTTHNENYLETKKAKLGHLL